MEAWSQQGVPDDQSAGPKAARSVEISGIEEYALEQTDTQYERNPDYIFRRIVDELVLVPIHQDVADMDCIYTLNPAGAFIWERLDRPATRAELRAALLDEYEADPETIAADLEGFLGQMVAIGAVREV